MDGSSTPPVRLSELVAAMSLVADLGMGRPMERGMRVTVIALRLADAAGTEPDIRAATYYTSLLTWVGCGADTSELVDLFGDEAELYADTRDADLDRATMAMFVARHLGRGTSPVRRVAMVGRFVLTAGRSVQRVMESHCSAAAELARHLDLGPTVCDPLGHAFERWDGQGVPGRVEGTDLAEAMRLVHLADAIEAFHRAGGRDLAVEVVEQRRGTQFDPALVDRFVADPDAVLEGIADIRAWDEVIAADPLLGRTLTDEQLETALEAMADFADLKAPTRTGHSRGVAALADGAARHLGLPDADVAIARRAGLVHDIGMIGVSSTVWNEPGRWSVSQRERARTHPYLTERMLAHIPALAPVSACAALHHERLDGSGYPRGLRGDSIPMTARIVAAADVAQALGQPRPHRGPLPAPDVASTLREEVRAGHLDGDAVEAVLGAAGHRVRRRPTLPGGLTPREVEVLVLLARGSSNPQIAEQLTVSRKTVSSHLEHIYAKLGISTRTEAALFAMQHGLVADG